MVVDIHANYSTLVVVSSAVATSHFMTNVSEIIKITLTTVSEIKCSINEPKIKSSYSGCPKIMLWLGSYINNHEYNNKVNIGSCVIKCTSSKWWASGDVSNM